MKFWGHASSSTLEGHAYAELYVGLDKREWFALHVQNRDGEWRVARLPRVDFESMLAAYHHREKPS